MTNETLILAAVFVGVLMISFLIVNYLNSRRDIDSLLRGSDSTYFGAQVSNDDRIEEIITSDNEYVRHYFNVIKKQNTQNLEYKLIQAGYFSKGTLNIYNTIRLIASTLVFVVTAYFLDNVVAEFTTTLVILLAMIMSAIVFILCNAVIDRMIIRKRIAYRKLFPDFMDMLIVCVDAGLSIEAAVSRVTREMMQTHPDFGTHLNIMLLEVRAGRPLRDALANFADRVSIDEAKSLATLFKQSEELGSDVTKALRVFSREMRQMRMIRAEEKANALPIKMLFPLAFFLFPTNLIIVLVPLLIRIGKMFESLAPN